MEVMEMPMNEKELNCNLFDKLDMLEDIQEVAEKENATETLLIISKKKRQIERKLYQQPPLNNN